MDPATLQKQQQFYNKAAGLTAGVGGLLGQGMGMMGEAESINTNAPSQQTDSFGRPIFNIGGFASQVNGIRPQGAQGAEIGTGVLNGAQAGAAFGLPGAAIGAVVGGIGSAIFGGARKREQQRRKNIAQQNLANAQKMYTASMNQFNNQQAAQAQYNDLENTDGRMQNITAYNSAA